MHSVVPPVVRHQAPQAVNADIVDLPDLPGEGDDVRGVADDLERGRPVQPVDDGGEGAVPVDPDERAGVRLRRRALDVPSQKPCERAYSVRPRPNSTSTSEPGAGGHLVAVVDFGPNVTTLPSCGQVGTGPASAM